MYAPIYKRVFSGENDLTLTRRIRYGFLECSMSFLRGNKKIIFLSLVIFFFFQVGTAHAQFFRIQTEKTPLQVQTEIIPTPTLTKQQRQCEKRQVKNKKVIKVGAQSIPAMKKKVDGFKSEFDKKIDNLEKVKCDVRQLRKDQQTLNRLYDDLYKQWEKPYSAYVSGLKEGQKVSCQTDSAVFVAVYKSAGNNLTEASKSMEKNQKRISEFMKKTITPHLGAVICE